MCEDISALQRLSIFSKEGKMCFIIGVGFVRKGLKPIKLVIQALKVGLTFKRDYRQ